MFVENEKITIIETLEIDKIINFKVICATKSAVLQSLVKSEDLKKIMQQDVTITKGQLKELKELIKQSKLLNE